jgi:Four helix bundle sensory module for signal transduction
MRSPRTIGLSVRAKLLGMAAVPLLFMAAVGVASLISLANVQETARDMHEQSVLGLGDAGRAYAALEEARVIFNKDLLEPDATKRVGIETQLAGVDNKVDDQLALLERTLVTAEERRTFEDRPTWSRQSMGSKPRSKP